MSKVINTFTRVEDKYVLPLGLLDSFLAQVNKNLPPSYLDANTKYTLIQSLYFDSSELVFFRQHFQQLPKRVKLRVRRYGPDGVWQNGVAFLESKYKIDGISSKQRFSITNEQYETLLKNGRLEGSPEFFAINSNLDSQNLLGRLNDVTSIMEKFHVVPKMNIEYKRLAFEADKVRCTIDQGIRFDTLSPVNAENVAGINGQDFWPLATSMRGLFNNKSHFLVELKHAGVRPEWFEEFMATHKVAQCLFSKYCWGTVQLIDNTLRSVGQAAKTSSKVG